MKIKIKAKHINSFRASFATLNEILPDNCSGQDLKDSIVNRCHSDPSVDSFFNIIAGALRGIREFNAQLLRKTNKKKGAKATVVNGVDVKNKALVKAQKKAARKLFEVQKKHTKKAEKAKKKVQKIAKSV